MQQQLHSSMQQVVTPFLIIELLFTLTAKKFLVVESIARLFWFLRFWARRTI